MNEDNDVVDAFQFLNNVSKRSTVGVTEENVKTKESGFSNSSFGYVADYQGTDRARRKKTHVIGVHKAKCVENVTDYNVENILVPGKFVTSAEGFKNNMHCDKMSSMVSGIKFNTPYVQELERKGVVMKDSDIMQKDKEHMMGRIHDYSDNICKCCKKKIEASSYGSGDIAEEKPNLKGFPHTLSVIYDEKADKANCSKEDIGREEVSVNANQDDVTKILTDAVKHINNNNENVNQYLSFGRTNIKKSEKKTKFLQNPVYEKEFTSRVLDPHEMCKNSDINTLGDSLAYFGLTSYLQQLEMSLEDVRRNIKKKEDHEEFFKQIDKEIQKLSFKYHPDRVKNRGGTEDEITTAQNLQTAINATRTALKILNSAFTEDIGTDHKFGFYTKLSIGSLSNEDEIKYRIYEVIFKIGVISRIKQQNIISEIRKFLIESKNCVHSYLGTKNDFEKYRDLALFHLKCCIKGFKKLGAELEDVKEQCKSEKDGENMHSFIQKMTSDNKRDLNQVKRLKKMAKASLKGNYQLFTPEGYMDPYFVLPLVSYTNVILMCNVMVRSSSAFEVFYFQSESHPLYREDLAYLIHPSYLASYCSGNKFFEKIVLKILNKTRLNQYGFKLEVSTEEIELEFYKSIENISVFMEYMFKVDDYNEAMTTSHLMLDLKKCMAMMTEFQKKQQELSKGIKEFQKKTEKMDEKYERFDKIMETAEELNQKLKERLEKSKILSEKVSNALSDQI